MRGREREKALARVRARREGEADQTGFEFDESLARQAEPKAVEGLEGVGSCLAVVACGRSHTLAVTVDGQVLLRCVCG